MPLLELDIHPKLVQYIKLAEAYTGLGSEHVSARRGFCCWREKKGSGFLKRSSRR